MSGSASRVSLLAAAIASTFACTTLLGIDKPYVLDPSGGGGGAAATSGSTGGAAGSGGGGIPLDEVCASDDYYAPCTLFAARCCAQLGLHYDASGCEAKAKSACASDVAAVQADDMTYHAEEVEKCKAALAAFHGSCAGDVIAYIDFYTAFLPCWRVFQGHVGEGESCIRSEECAPSSHPKAARLCTNGKCTDVGLLVRGEVCGDVHLGCDKGLYCASDSSTCKPAVALGGGCDSSIPGICGPGAYCPSATSICAPALPVGSACMDGSWCETEACTNSVCASIPALETQAGCDGSG